MIYRDGGVACRMPSRRPAPSYISLPAVPPHLLRPALYPEIRRVCDGDRPCTKAAGPVAALLSVRLGVGPVGFRPAKVESSRRCPRRTEGEAQASPRARAEDLRGHDRAGVSHSIARGAFASRMPGRKCTYYWSKTTCGCRN